MEAIKCRVADAIAHSSWHVAAARDAMGARATPPLAANRTWPGARAHVGIQLSRVDVTDLYRPRNLKNK